MGPRHQSPSPGLSSPRPLISQTQRTQQKALPRITRSPTQRKTSTTNRIKTGSSRTSERSPSKIKSNQRLERQTSSTVLLIKEKPLHRPTRTRLAKIQINPS